MHGVCMRGVVARYCCGLGQLFLRYRGCTSSFTCDNAFFTCEKLTKQMVGLAEVTVSCPLTAVNATQIEKKAKKETAAEGLQPVPNGIEWKSYDDTVIENVVRHQTVAFVEQLRIAQSPTQSEVAILAEDNVVVAKEVLKPLALTIIPRIVDLRLAATGDDVDNADAGDYVDITVTFNGNTAKFRPLGTNSHESRLNGTTNIIDPFEFIKATSNNARTYGGGCVELKRVCSGDLSVPFSDYTTTDANLRPSKKSQTRLECKISYWTNEATVPMGCALALTR